MKFLIAGQNSQVCNMRLTIAPPSADQDADECRPENENVCICDVTKQNAGDRAFGGWISSGEIQQLRVRFATRCYSVDVYHCLTFNSLGLLNSTRIPPQTCLQMTAVLGRRVPNEKAAGWHCRCCRARALQGNTGTAPTSAWSSPRWRKFRLSRYLAGKLSIRLHRKPPSLLSLIFLFRIIQSLWRERTIVSSSSRRVHQAAFLRLPHLCAITMNWQRNLINLNI